MYCPVCKNVELKMSDRQGVEVDYCPQCRGVWLDRGELDKIIERSALIEAQSQPTRTQDGQDDRYYDEEDDRGNDRYPQKRKRKSFLGDMFDIFD
jgi:uncharacterized protein